MTKNILLMVFGINTAVTLALALYRTYKKEKEMILEGGEPLPTSSYIFLAINHVIQAILYYLGIYLFFPETIEGDLPLAMYLLALIVLVQFFTIVVETIIRVIAVQFYYQRKKKQLDSQLYEEDE